MAQIYGEIGAFKELMRVLIPEGISELKQNETTR